MEYLSIINAPIEPTPDIDVNIVPDLTTSAINGVVDFSPEIVDVVYDKLRIFISPSNSLEKYKVFLNSIEVESVRGYYPISPKLGENLIYIVETKSPNKGRNCGNWQLNNVTYVLPLSRQSSGEQLSTPQLSVSNLSYTSLTLNSSVVPNALSYLFKRGSSVLGTSLTPSFNVTGLTDNTQYTFSVVAKATGFIDSLPGTITTTTLETSEPIPGQPLLTPSFQLTPSTQLY